MKIIDTHTHFTDGDWMCPGETETPVEEIIATQDAYGITEMWMSSLGAIADDYAHYNRNMYEKTKKYADRIKLFAVARPYGRDKAVEEIRHCLRDLGFSGVKLHYWMQGGMVQGKASRQMMDVAAEYKAPVLFHDGTPPGTDSLQIAWLAEKHPDTKMILGHSGLYDSPRSAMEAVCALPNLYLCVSANTLADIRMFIEHAPHDRLLYGSDYDAAKHDTTLIDNRVDAIKAVCGDEALLEKIFYTNPKALMG